LQNYLLLFLRMPSGWRVGEHPKTGDTLPYLFTDCAPASGCHFAFSLTVNA
jgi:hypothetical protein